MTILLTCHDTGTTNALLRVANDLKKQGQNGFTLLLAGKAAWNILKKPENLHLQEHLVFLFEWLHLENFDSIESRELSASELQTIETRLHDLNITKAITTSTAFKNAHTPFQISQLLIKFLKKSDHYLYNGWFFQDAENDPFWSYVEQDWMSQLSICVVFPHANDLILKKNENVTLEVVGHPALDDMFTETSNLEKRKTFRTRLSVSDAEHLLFISGSKTIEDDIQLLDSLYEALKQNAHATVRIGMHPGTENITEYLTLLFEWIDRHPESKIVPIIPPAVQNKISPEKKSELLSHPSLKSFSTQEFNGDDIYCAADSVASAYHFTHITQAIIQNKPAYALPPHPLLSYYLDESFFCKTPHLLFTSRNRAHLTRTDLGLPKESASQTFRKLLGR